MTVWLTVLVLLAMGTVAATTVGVWKLVADRDASSVAQPREPGESGVVPVPADDPADRERVLDSAKGAVAKVLSYQADTVEADVAAAASVTTGEFRDYYEKFTRDVVIPSTRENGVNSTAKVVGAGLVSLTEKEAVVLTFVNQTTSSRAEPEPKQTASAVRVTLVKGGEHHADDGDTWLIEAFDPV